MKKTTSVLLNFLTAFAMLFFLSSAAMANNEHLLCANGESKNDQLQKKIVPTPDIVLSCYALTTKASADLLLNQKAAKPETTDGVQPGGAKALHKNLPTAHVKTVADKDGDPVATLRQNGNQFKGYNIATDQETCDSGLQNANVNFSSGAQNLQAASCDTGVTFSVAELQQSAALDPGGSISGGSYTISGSGTQNLQAAHDLGYTITGADFSWQASVTSNGDQNHGGLQQLPVMQTC